MIFTGVFVNMAETRYTSGTWNDTNRKAVNEWVLLRELLENTGDTVIYVITRSQLPTFEPLMKKYKLDQFLVVDHRDVDGKEQGSANWNYPGDPRKLKVMIFQGKGEVQ